MRILVLMTTTRDIALQAPDVNVKSPLLALCHRGCHFRWLLSAALCGWAAATTQASLAPSAFPLDQQGLAAATNTLSLPQGPEGFYPLLGVLAAVACTYVLRRRRIAQLEAASIADR